MSDQLQNQFEQSVIKGLVDQRQNPSVLSARVKNDEATPLKAAQAVTMVDSAGGAPEVTAATDDADDIWAFVVFNQKQFEFPKETELEVAFARGSVIYMEASEAIARDAEIAIVVADQKIKTAAATDRIIGRALDKASGDGQLIRVTIDLHGVIKS